jgi:hypothetical protein
MLTAYFLLSEPAHFLAEVSPRQSEPFFDHLAEHDAMRKGGGLCE